MNFINNLKIGKRLGAAFAVLLAMTVALGAFAVIQLGKVNQTSTDMEVNWMPSVRTTGNINTAISKFRLAELQHILSVDEAEMVVREKAIAELSATIAKESEHYEKLISDESERKDWSEFKRLWEQYTGEHVKIIKLSRANQDDEARQLVRGNSKEYFDEAGALLDHLVEINIKGGQAASRMGDVLYESARNAVIGTLLAALAVGVAGAVLVTRSITRPLTKAVEVAEAVAAGDLTSDIEINTSDETGQLLTALKNMNDSLAGIVGNVRQSSDSIATGSAQIATGNADLSQRTEEQASNLQQTAASMEQLTSTVKQNADTARQANQLASSASKAAAQGGVAVGQVVGTMQEITASSKKISDIIGVIDGIAFQTNILALNAAVEAARAGEQGRGFAVVASEVRSLAQRSAGAAKEIKTLIGESVEKVEAGSKLVDDAGKSMDDIVSQVKRVSDLIAEISAASVEQTQGIGQVGDAVQQLDQVTQQNAALVEESAAAADSLRQQAARLAEVVGVFKVGPPTADSSAAP